MISHSFFLSVRMVKGPGLFLVLSEYMRTFGKVGIIHESGTEEKVRMSVFQFET